MAQIHNAAFNTLSALDAQMKNIAGNVTGSSVVGFKGSDLEFTEVLTQQIRGQRGGIGPLQRSDSGIAVKGSRTNFKQGAVTATNQKHDLAINGDGFFILSKTPTPRDFSELVFTRNGQFKTEFENGPVPGSGAVRLINQDGYYVMGFNSQVSPANPFGTPPAELVSRDPNTLSTLRPVRLDQVRNPNASDATINEKGQVFVNGIAPKDVDGNDINLFVGITRVQNNQGLSRGAGAAYFKYTTAAGDLFTGVAGITQNGVVGSNNVLSVGALEQANTNINTSVPEITLAQKSFSAASKIISVGNTMIDDVNQLIR
jgi:flagellar hook protein FlgE